MRMAKKIKICCVSIWVSATLSLSAVAQVSGKAFEGFVNQEAPIYINSDRLKILDHEKQLIYQGNVNVQQETSIIKTDNLTVHYTGQGQPESIQRLEFNGEVVASSGDSIIAADKGTYYVEKSQVILAGNIIASQGENQAEGCRLIVDLKTNVAELLACGERVNTIINTDIEIGNKEQ